MYQDDYKTIVDLDLSDEEDNTNLPEQNPDHKLRLLKVAADVQREAEKIRNDIDRLKFFISNSDCNQWKIKTEICSCVVKCSE
ncbi:hypothetical protein Lal_00022371 [Lupinus albus]|nr:hypothetical protein Lal_00022371 [Lupinus albus]